MKTFRFLEFPVYKDAKDFNNLSVQITRVFGRLYWGLADQWRRAALSIVLNIAEGSAKYSDRDFNRYVENALGSVSECAACIDIAENQGLLKGEQPREMKEMCNSIAKQLGGLSKKLRSTSS